MESNSFKQNTLQFLLGKLLLGKTLFFYFLGEGIFVSVPICEHIKPSGARCASPAMRSQRFCYYHVGARECLPVGRGMFVDSRPRLADAPPEPEFPIPFLEDAAAIQIGYMQALYGITNHRLDPREARLILAALDGARTNLKQMEACVTACAKSTSAKTTKKQAASVKRASGKSSRTRLAKMRA